ncbi:hypothetical protein C8Q79DRAFT_999240 [Trametes meyenii]|nr:hypothetical protein C8Q79DRAFT_999240 [Trametes meyenii]
MSLIAALAALCKFVRETDAETNEVSAFEKEEFIARADDLLNKGLMHAHARSMWEYIPSFAHDTSDIDGQEGRPLADRLQDYGPPKLAVAGPWTETRPPHRNTARLARFRDDVFDIAAIPPSASLAQTIYQALCEVTATPIDRPTDAVLATSDGPGCLAVTGRRGQGGLEPVLWLCPLGSQGDATDMPVVSLDPGLTEPASALGMDVERKLVFVADRFRIKSFSWDPAVPPTAGPSSGPNATGFSSTHTLCSKRFNGPLAILPGGKLIRAGIGKIGVWNIDDDTGSHKNERPLSEHLCARTDHENIDMTGGARPDATVHFEDKTLLPTAWHYHASTEHMLCAEDGARSGRYGCSLVDLEARGRKVVRFLGMGGAARSFSTTDADANVFAVAGGDGYARLYDVRHPLPVLTINTGKGLEHCPDALYVHPDGIPTLFTAGFRSHSVKLWDLRAGACVYELSTGNNVVVRMVWDAPRNILYAATKNEYLDAQGRHVDYRRADIPRWAAREGQVNDESRSTRWCDRDDEWDANQLSWPNRAFHEEDFFGYAYDAGGHALMSYNFKDNADPTVLPRFGGAS